MKYILILLLACLINGCAIFGSPTEIDDTKGWPAERIYQEASIKSKDKDYVKALEYFGKLESRYPNGAYAAQAQLETAYLYYKQGDPILSVAAADRFIKLHPNHPNLDYAYYLKGLAVFSERGVIEKLTDQDISDRDPRALRDSFLTFKDLLARFPESRYASDAAQRMVYLTNSLAEHEIYVARYYMTLNANVAAVNRAKQVIEYYPQSPKNEEALVIMVKAYDKMGMEVLKNDTLRILKQNYPDSAYFNPNINKDLNKDKWWQFWKVNSNDTLNSYQELNKSQDTNKWWKFW
jgi:outer membrane protein assembly factor BamD